jgi:four helix bundle protein
MGFNREKGDPTFNVQRSTLNVQVGGLMERVEEKGAYDLVDRLLEYAARVIRLCESPPQTRAGNHVAGQFLRCGTSPLANHAEAQGAESRRDFVHKLAICLKEIKECRRWLRLVQRIPLVAPPAKLDDLAHETEELIRIFASSVRTAMGNRQQKGYGAANVER